MKMWDYGLKLSVKIKETLLDFYSYEWENIS